MKIRSQQSNFASRVSNVPVSFLREILKVASNPSVVSFAGGLPNPESFPVKELEQCTAKVFQKHGRQALQYAGTEGYLPLRQYISKRYKTQFDLDIPAENILITNGSQQALDLIGKLFIDPGDVTLLERPCYLGALQCFSVFQPTFKEINLLENGPDLEELEFQLSTNSVKLFYTIPNFQNPSGISYSLEKRKQTAAILSRHQTIVVEDDPYGDIRFTDEIHPPLYSYIPDKTILLGSFSKTIAPGLRLGWMVAQEDIIKKATILKQAADLHTSNLAQYILHEFLCAYDCDEHIRKIRSVYKRQRDMMMECLDRYFPPSVSYKRPEGGMFTWLRIPEQITARDLLKRALEQDIIFVPGDSFYATDPDFYTLRLNYSNVEEVRMREAMFKLSKLIC